VVGIAVILDDRDVDPIEHLRRQHGLLAGRRDELSRMIDALEKTMEAHKLGIRLDPEELFEVFGDDDCPPAMHRSLGEMYLADPRFTKHYEDLAEGLAQWVHDAWAANADRQTSA
jgi:hypothetical protein